MHEIVAGQPDFAIGRAEKRSTVALVDDERSVLSAVSRLLRSHDFECLTYESGEAALADSRFLSADCIVLDIQMQSMDGFELRDRIRSAGSDAPCFFITAHLSADSEEWNQRMGATQYLLKPFDESQLISTIDRLIRDTHRDSAA